MRIFRHEFDRFAVGIDRTDIQGVVDKDPGRGLPGVAGGKIDAGLPRDFERIQARRAQIVIEDADRRGADHVARPGDRKGGNRQPAGERFEQHQAKGIGLARKYEHVGGGVDLGQFGAVPRAQEHRIRIFSLQRQACRPVADHNLGARQIEIEEGLEVLFDRHPADIEEDRHWQAQIDRARMKQRRIDAARPQHHVAEAARAQFSRQRRRCRHHRLTGTVEPAQPGPDPRIPEPAIARKHSPESGYGSSW